MRYVGLHHACPIPCNQAQYLQSMFLYELRIRNRVKFKNDFSNITLKETAHFGKKLYIN
jgi:hypothetical protein